VARAVGIAASWASPPQPDSSQTTARPGTRYGCGHGSRTSWPRSRVAGASTRFG